MTLSDQQVSVGDLVLGEGTPYALVDFNPWQRVVRATATGPRAWGHGSWSGAEFLDEVVVPFGIHVVGDDPTVAAWGTRHQALAAAFKPSFNDIELRWMLDGATEYLMYGRPRMVEPNIDTLAFGYAVTRAAFVALDPLVYSGALHSEEIGVAQFAGGLLLPSVVPGTGPFGLRLDGNSGNYASTPDHSSLDIVGDLDLRVDATMDDWTPSASDYLINKIVTTGNQRSYGLRISSSGNLELAWSTAGTSLITRTSTVAVTPAGNGRLAVRATLDVDNGASGHTVTFYTAPSLGGPWTQLGDPVVTAGVTSIFASTSALVVGGFDVGTSNQGAGYYHAAEVRSGIDGTVVAGPDFERQAHGATSFTERAGKVWTVTGSGASIVGRREVGGLIVPFTVDALQSEGVATLTNGGTAETGLTIRFDGPVTNPALAIRDPDGTVTTLQIQVTLTAGQYVEVDTRSETVFLNGSTASSLRSVAVGEFPLLAPGISEARFTSADASGSATVSWRDAWW